MLIKLLPPEPTPTVVFTLSAPNPPTHLPVPQSYTTALNILHNTTSPLPSLFPSRPPPSLSVNAPFSSPYGAIPPHPLSHAGAHAGKERKAGRVRSLNLSDEDEHGGHGELDLDGPEGGWFDLIAALDGTYLVPPSYHALDRASWPLALLEEVVFDLTPQGGRRRPGTGYTTLRYLDGWTTEWPIPPRLEQLLYAVIQGVEDATRMGEHERSGTSPLVYPNPTPTPEPVRAPARRSSLSALPHIPAYSAPLPQRSGSEPVVTSVNAHGQMQQHAPVAAPAGAAESGAGACVDGLVSPGQELTRAEERLRKKENEKLKMKRSLIRDLVASVHRSVTSTSCTSSPSAPSSKSASPPSSPKGNSLTLGSSQNSHVNLASLSSATMKNGFSTVINTERTSGTWSTVTYAHSMVREELLPKKPTPISQSRRLRRKARSLLLDAFREYVVAPLAAHSSVGGAYPSWDNGNIYSGEAGDVTLPVSYGFSPFFNPDCMYSDPFDDGKAPLTIRGGYPLYVIQSIARRVRARKAFLESRLMVTLPTVSVGRLEDLGRAVRERESWRRMGLGFGGCFEEGDIDSFAMCDIPEEEEDELDDLEYDESGEEEERSEESVKTPSEGHGNNTVKVVQPEEEESDNEEVDGYTAPLPLTLPLQIPPMVPRPKSAPPSLSPSANDGMGMNMGMKATASLLHLPASLPLAQDRAMRIEHEYLEMLEDRLDQLERGLEGERYRCIEMLVGGGACWSVGTPGTGAGGTLRKGKLGRSPLRDEVLVDEEEIEVFHDAREDFEDEDADVLNIAPASFAHSMPINVPTEEQFIPTSTPRRARFHLSTSPDSNSSLSDSDAEEDDDPFLRRRAPETEDGKRGIYHPHVPTPEDGDDLTEKRPASPSGSSILAPAGNGQNTAPTARQISPTSTGTYSPLARAILVRRSLMPFNPPSMDMGHDIGGPAGMRADQADAHGEYLEDDYDYDYEDEDLDIDLDLEGEMDEFAHGHGRHEVYGMSDPDETLWEDSYDEYDDDEIEETEKWETRSGNGHGLIDEDPFAAPSRRAAARGAKLNKEALAKDSIAATPARSVLIPMQVPSSVQPNDVDEGEEEAVANATIRPSSPTAGSMGRPSLDTLRTLGSAPSMRKNVFESDEETLFESDQEYSDTKSKRRTKGLSDTDSLSLSSPTSPTMGRRSLDLDLVMEDVRPSSPVSPEMKQKELETLDLGLQSDYSFEADTKTIRVDGIPVQISLPGGKKGRMRKAIPHEFAGTLTASAVAH